MELLIYPAVLAFLAVTATLGLASYVTSPISGIWNRVVLLFALPTRIILAASNFAHGILLEVGPVFLFLRYRSTEAGRYQLDQLKLKMPVVKDRCKIVTARFLQHLGYSYQCGYPLVEAIDSPSRNDQ